MTQTHVEPRPRRPDERQEPVSVLWSRRIRKRSEVTFEEWAHHIKAAARDFPGHLGASVLNVPGSREYHVLYIFADRTNLERWLDSTERAAMKPPPRWKMWLVTVAAIYPLILLLFGLLSPVISEWPLPLRALIFPVILVTLMTYVVMPPVMRLLRGWLAPRT